METGKNGVKKFNSHGAGRVIHHTKFYYTYGEGVGEIKYSYAFYSSPDHYEARLVRYHVR